MYLQRSCSTHLVSLTKLNFYMLYTQFYTDMLVKCFVSPKHKHVDSICNTCKLFSAAVPDKKEEFEIENLDFEMIPAHLEKSCIIDRSEPGVLCHQSADIESVVRDMVSVAVRIKLDSTPLSDLTRDEKIKVSYQEHC